MAQALVLSDISQIRHAYHLAQNQTYTIYIYASFKKSKHNMFLVLGLPFCKNYKIRCDANHVITTYAILCVKSRLFCNDFLMVYK